MLLDKQNTVSNQQSLVAAVGTVVSTDSIDLWGQAAVPTVPGLGGSVLKDIGRGKEPELLCQITEQVTSGGAGTLQFQLVMADDDALTTNPVVLQETVAIAKATLVPGYQARLCIPVGVSKRYLGAKYVIGTADLTGGKVTAGIVMDKQTSFVG